MSTYIEMLPTLETVRTAIGKMPVGLEERPEVILLDNGLIGRGSHSYHLAKEVLLALRMRKLRHRIYGTTSVEKQIIAETGAIPHFRLSLYDHAGLTDILKFLNKLIPFRHKPKRYGLKAAELASVKVLNWQFKRDLARLPETWGRNNVVVVPGISQNQIFGLIDQMNSIAEANRPTVICQLMFSPAWTPWQDVSAYGEGFYREAFERAKPLLQQSLFFTTDNKLQHDLYLEQFGIETDRLPIPFAVTIPETKATADDERSLKAGFFGHSKMEKGFHLLPEAIELCRAMGQSIEFVIQIQHGRWERATIEAENKLRRIPGVRLIEGTMSSIDYYREMNDVDILLLPYDPSTYGSRGSGIHVEAAASGHPIVSTGGTSIGQSIRFGDVEGEVFDTYTAHDLAIAIGKLILRFADCEARALQRRENFALAHSGASYVDVLLTLHNRRRRQQSIFFENNFQSAGAHRFETSVLVD